MYKEDEGELALEAEDKNESACRWRGIRGGREDALDSKSSLQTHLQLVARYLQAIAGRDVISNHWPLRPGVLYRPMSGQSFSCLLYPSFCSVYGAWCVIIIVILSPALWYVLGKW